MNWKLFVPLGLFAAGAVGGYMYASHEYGEEIANVKLQAAIVRANDGRKAYEKLVAAQNALDASRRDAVRFSDDLDRVRRTSQRKHRASCRGFRPTSKKRRSSRRQSNPEQMKSARTNLAHGALSPLANLRIRCPAVR